VAKAPHRGPEIADQRGGQPGGVVVRAYGRLVDATVKTLARGFFADTDLALVMMITPEAIESPAYQVVCAALEVDCDGEPLRLRQGFGAAAGSNTLTLATRSLFSAIYHLSRHVDAPIQDVEAGYANPSVDLNDQSVPAANALRQLFHVRSSATEPEHASVKVFYRDTWFYIADADQDSKTTFALLSMLVTLKSGDASGVMPLITIPSG